ncbi:MAG: site-2 protease family protein [Actinomycetota bacterium]
MLFLLVQGAFVQLIFLGVLLLVGIVLHEIAHVLAASSFGDDSTMREGRLTFNPRRHLEPFGVAAIVLVGYGWGKGVPFHSRRFGRGKRDVILVALAGPAANVVLSLLAAGILRVLNPSGLVRGFLLAAVAVNLTLAIVHLFPVPPLDGYPILAQLLPPSHSRVLEFLDRWNVVILILMVFIVPALIVRSIVPALGNLILGIFGVT